MFDLLVLHNRVPQIAAPSNNHFVVTRNWKMQEDGFCPVIPKVSAGDAQARGGGGGERGGSFSHLLWQWWMLLSAWGLVPPWPEPRKQTPHMAWASSQHGSTPRGKSWNPCCRAPEAREGTGNEEDSHHLIWCPWKVSRRSPTAS